MDRLAHSLSYDELDSSESHHGVIATSYSAVAERSNRAFDDSDIQLVNIRRAATERRECTCGDRMKVGGHFKQCHCQSEDEYTTQCHCATVQCHCAPRQYCSRPMNIISYEKRCVPVYRQYQCVKKAMPVCRCKKAMPVCQCKKVHHEEQRHNVTAEDLIRPTDHVQPIKTIVKETAPAKKPVLRDQGIATEVLKCTTHATMTDPIPKPILRDQATGTEIQRGVNVGTMTEIIHVPVMPSSAAGEELRLVPVKTVKPAMIKKSFAESHHVQQRQCQCFKVQMCAPRKVCYPVAPVRYVET